MKVYCVHCGDLVDLDDAVPAGNLDASAHPECQADVEEMWKEED